MNHRNLTRIIVIGGGFAGVRCARTLRKRLTPEACEIVLFDRENSMAYYPLLAEVAGATIGVVVHDVPAANVVVGNPARIIRALDVGR